MASDRLELIQGDITKLDVDAIVNAANSGLRGGGGVDGAIHRAGGRSIMEECRKIIAEIGALPTGEAVITGGGDLPARYVIHTVGPVYDPDEAAEMQRLLGACYTNSLEIAVDKQCRTVAFPNISTGVYGYPKDQAASVAVDAVSRFLRSDKDLKKIYYVCFDKENYTIYADLLK